ncbi:hypothetical protein F4808DRAFT_466624, partial [Astrocystis sublimbata]
SRYVCSTQNANRNLERYLKEQCYLVSRPLEGNMPSGTLEWKAIGNGSPVPSLLDRQPYLEHWALCIFKAKDLDPSEPTARNAFLTASYYDFGVRSADQGWFKASTSSQSHTVFDSFTWTPSHIRNITCVEHLGAAAITKDMVAEYRSELIRLWDTYEPLSWNCQHFAMLLARLTIDSPYHAQKIHLLFRSQSTWLKLLKHNWGECLKVAATMACNPLLGYLGVQWLVTNRGTGAKAPKALAKVAARFEELEDVIPNDWWKESGMGFGKLD